MIVGIIGWIGGFLLAICSVPQVYKTWKTKSAKDLSWLFLWFWFFGELLILDYIIIGDIINKIYHFPLYLNYSVNLALVYYLVYAKAKYG